MIARRLIQFAGFALLCGCATMDESECRSADWYAVGLRDGQNGEPVSRLAKHSEACAEHGVRPQEQRYSEGRAAGLKEYCRIENAFDTGIKGHRYQGVCPPSMDSQFRRYNGAAYEVYRLRSDIKSTQSAIDGKESRLRDRKATDDQRTVLRKDIRDLDRKLERLRDDLRIRERELDWLADEARLRRRY